MSDDSVELGGFGPTTPAHPSIKPKAKPRGGTTAKPLTKQRAQNGVNQEPGSSKHLTRNTVRRPSKRKRAEEIVVESEVEVDVDGEGNTGDGLVQEVNVHVMEGVVASSDEDEMRADVQTQLNGHGTNTRARENGRTQQIGKPPSSSSRQQQKSLAKTIEVRASDEEENVEEDVIHTNVPPPRESRAGKAAQKMKATGGRTIRQPKRKQEESAMGVDEVLNGQDGIVALIDEFGRPSALNERAPVTTGGPSSATDAQLARLKEKLSRASNAIALKYLRTDFIIQLEKENKALSNQMEELFRVRETEAEALMQRSEEQYEAKIRALEEVNQALTEQLVKKQPLAGMGRSSVLNFITREAADAEKQTLEREIGKLKAELDDAMKKLKLKDEEIEEKKQTEKELRFELKAEIERANSLAKQAPRHQPTPRSGVAAEDPKHREAIKLYEDLTNIIVLNIRSSPGGHGKKDEWQFTCCYTHTNETDSVNPSTRSLSFIFRSYEQLDDEGQLRDWVQYLPTSLDKETEDFREKLNFLNASFQFERNQLALFLRTLYTTVEEIVKAGDESDDEEQEQETEPVY